MTKGPPGGGKTGPKPTDRGTGELPQHGTRRRRGRPPVANRHDTKLTQITLEAIMAARPAATEQAPLEQCVDKAHDYDEVRSLVAEFDFTAHIRTRGEDAVVMKKKAG